MLLKLYLIALPVFFAIDMLWIGFLAKNFYRQQIGFLMKEQINWTSAILFYLIFIVGLVVFAIEPALSKSSLLQAIIFGALFGFISYAAYDLTNMATIRDWPLPMTIVDMAWGAFIAASVSAITYLIATKTGL